MNLRFIILAAVTLMLACCARQHDARLDRAADLSAQYPDSALALLDSIAPASLSTADRHYRDLLSIRAHDKAYHPHTSDSLILDVIDYYADHRSAPDHYPMALYYGGRVYRDLGDYPTAMKYFQDALDHLPPDTPDQDLRCCVLSQYGTLLDYLRLYDEAIAHIKSVIEIEEATNDTVNLIYNYQSLAYIYLRTKNYELAEQSLIKAIDLGKNMPYQHTMESLTSLAYIKSRSGKIDEALSIIRSLPFRSAISNSECQNLSEIASIYFMAGILDTTYVFCQEILESDDLSSKAVAYQLLLSPQMIDTLPTDSLGKYIWDYRKLLERFFDGNQTEYALNQQNQYNYQFHDRERVKAERDRAILENYALVALLIISLLVSTTLYFKNKSQRNVIELHDALDYIKMLKAGQSPLTDADTDSMSDDKPLVFKGNEFELRNRLKTELLDLCNNVDQNNTVDTSIILSEAYVNLQESIKNKRVIVEDNPLWDELEKAILQTSPQFSSHLNVLAQGKLTKSELHTAILIKCGLKPAQMKIVLSKTSGTIVSRRISICQKMFDKKMATNVIDAIIRSL